MVLTAKQFETRIRRLILLTWVLPPVIGLSFLVYIKMFSVGQMADILTSPIEPVFVIGAIIFTLWYFKRYLQPVCRWRDGDKTVSESRMLEILRRFPIHYWTVFLVYLLLAPTTVILSGEYFSDFRASPADWFRIHLVALVVSIVVGLPIFFRILDLFGKMVGDVPFKHAHTTIKTKVFLIGALTPLLIDTMLVLYYWTRTGFFTVETFVIWLALEILAVGGALIFVASFSQSLKPLQKLIDNESAYESLKEDDLIPQSTDELAVITTGYRKLLEDLHQHQAGLEKQVEQRTRDLQYAYDEMKSFSYSVSHDLRAPLRGINGFCQILEEDFRDKLGEEGRVYLAKIRTAAEKMGTLIDALLSLSEVARAEPELEQVNLSEIATSVASDLKDRDETRKIRFDIKGDINTRADKGMMRVVFENIMGNAWKFTSGTSEAVISFGEAHEQGEAVYYIRDTGVGFDMAHAGKLFGAFNRVHSDNEFEGLGIGLATVERIIKRHRGRIWAEGTPGNGATFYFTLGNHRSSA